MYGTEKVSKRQVSKFQVNNINFHFKKLSWVGGFPGGPVVGTLCFYCRVRSLVGELRSRMLHSAAKKKKKKLEKLIKIKVKISRSEEIIEEGQKLLKWKADER